MNILCLTIYCFFQCYNCFMGILSKQLIIDMDTWCAFWKIAFQYMSLNISKFYCIVCQNHVHIFSLLFSAEHLVSPTSIQTLKIYAQIWKQLVSWKPDFLQVYLLTCSHECSDNSSDSEAAQTGVYSLYCFLQAHSIIDNTFNQYGCNLICTALASSTSISSSTSSPWWQLFST